MGSPRSLKSHAYPRIVQEEVAEYHAQPKWLCALHKLGVVRWDYPKAGDYCWSLAAGWYSRSYTGMYRVFVWNVPGLPPSVDSREEKGTAT